ncbi:MAG: hypothetical protein MJ131_05325 [Lachnospiraceae bacterium]|nr:hypothetical protein [Lachnospiraceae bacterium]
MLETKIYIIILSVMALSFGIWIAVDNIKFNKKNAKKTIVILVVIGVAIVVGFLVYFFGLRCKYSGGKLCMKMQLTNRKYCFAHTCGAFACRDEVYDEYFQLCEYHHGVQKQISARRAEAEKQCSEYDCDKLEIQGGEYCVDHTCVFTNCKNVKIGSSNYCYTHKCEGESVELPYVGMSERYLSSTGLGTAYFYGGNHIGTGKGYKSSDIYYYYKDRDIIFAVNVVEGVVFHISDYRDNPWKRPTVYKSKPYSYKNTTYSSSTGSSGSSSGQVTGASDPYDVHNYYDADDFADEWGDDFDDWDEAFDYWEDNY